MDNLNPAISVLLPVKHWRSTTRQAIDSVLSQTLSDFEILLIGHDDVKTFQDRIPADPRIRLIARDAPGIVAALNTGLKHARGQFIARMDDDDISYPQRFEAQLRFLKNNNHVGLCAARIRFIDTQDSPQGIAGGNRRYQQWLNSLVDTHEIRHSCLIECPMPHPTLMAHRDVWQQLQGYRDFDGPEDYDLVLRAMLQDIAMGKPEPVLLDWREHEHRLTHTDLRYRLDSFTRCRAWAVTQPESGLNLHEGRGVWLCGTGRNARRWHDALVNLHVNVKGFVDIDKHVDRSGSAQSRRGKPVISYAQLATLRKGDLVITALSQPGARVELIKYFEQQGWHSRQDYVLGG